MALEKLKLGYCPNCGKEIFDFKLGRPVRRNKEYDEFWTLLSDGSKMRIAICKSCKPKLRQTEVNFIMDRHNLTWTDEVNKSTKIKDKKTHLKRFKNLKVKEFGSVETSV